MVEPNRRAVTHRRRGSPATLAALALLVVECGREEPPPGSAPEGPATAVVSP